MPWKEGFLMRTSCGVKTQTSSSSLAKGKRTTEG
jgi:hypothetical protein